MSTRISLPGTKISSNHTKLYKSLGSLIKDYRQWHGVSQESLAESIGISDRKLRNWEADRRGVHIKNLHDLSEITGIPMQVCIALNADQPIWYSLQEKWFAYSSEEIMALGNNELYINPELPDNAILIKNERITTDRQISMILSCHQDIYGKEKPLGGDAIRTASTILPVT